MSQKALLSYTMFIVAVVDDNIECRNRHLPVVIMFSSFGKLLLFVNHSALTR